MPVHKHEAIPVEDGDVVLAILLEMGIPPHASEIYAPKLVGLGFDTAKAMKTLTPADMDTLEIKEGHRRLIQAHASLHSKREHASSVSAPAATASAGRGSAVPASPPSKRARRSPVVERAAPVLTGSGLPLDGLILCVSGTMSMIRRQFHEMLQERGARVVLSATGNTTHLITTSCEAESPTRKVLAAMDKKVHIVSEQFIHDCIAHGSIVDDAPYLLVAPSGGVAAWPAGSRSGRGGTGAAASSSGGSAGVVVGGGGLFAGPGCRLGGSGAAGSAGSGAGGVERDLIVAARASGPAVTLSSDKTSEAAARLVMLAQKWEFKLDPAGWWMSEKLDGVRGYWDGKNFYSRLGNQFPAPEWFKQGLPKTPLDGELWCGRRQFRRCLSIVRNRSSGKLWEYITYLVFDAPAMKAPYEERVAFIKSVVVPTSKPDRTSSSSTGPSSSTGSGCPYAAPVGVVLCKCAAHLKAELAQVDAKGGEGLMLREPKSLYENKRSKTLRKVKSLSDEEAKVVGHEGGRGIAFRLGALTLMTPDGRQFSCGTGFSAEDRKHPPAIGSIVTYRFTELMDNGYPRFPVYVGPRIDIDWDELCARYKAPSAASHARGELRRDHSIMFADADLAETLTTRAESLPAPAALAEGEALASEGSEGGDTEVEGSDGSDSPRALKCIRDLGKGGGAAAQSSAITRSRSQCFADEAGLDLATARSLLGEHDKVPH